ncbi:hypothetical protein FA10DRAFT_262486 [Acaromyces ingoldii]|uniref:Uncharacterized protein n=1 Tax=Acaromyces ingoldii TaxID=215250 RepID=A0A316YCU4_9BASI|nr:hypothetical protein FA10DRAFT_262486 [Acaromyces ingoldii]PWN87316.1 hypothetical protein FA10DRAFT_262486 [Acaromyces ingoldii]
MRFQISSFLLAQVFIQMTSTLAMRRGVDPTGNSISRRRLTQQSSYDGSFDTYMDQDARRDDTDESFMNSRLDASTDRLATEECSTSEVDPKDIETIAQINSEIGKRKAFQGALGVICARTDEETLAMTSHAAAEINALKHQIRELYVMKATLPCREHYGVSCWQELMAMKSGNQDWSKEVQGYIASFRSHVREDRSTPLVCSSGEPSTAETEDNRDFHLGNTSDNNDGDGDDEGVSSCASSKGPKTGEYSSQAAFKTTAP